MIRIFNHCFDIQYLELLADKLEFGNLKMSAIPLERKEHSKTYRPKPNDASIPFKGVIKIDFCGFAATTLLGEDSKELQEYIRVASFPKLASIVKLRTEIKQRFERILTDINLGKINKAGIYLQIRFCFSYLYSDYPISLMRAADKDIWDDQMSDVINFSKNAPMAAHEWRNSYLYRAQQASLTEIGRLCRKYPYFSRIRKYDEAINTLETRFAVIPIPIELLIINDAAIAEANIYSKVTHNHLPVGMPVTIVERQDPVYEVWRQNFLYIWRHDLTMYADMCTNFSEKDPEGITTLIPPIVPGTEKNNIDWDKKIIRIANKRKTLDNSYDRHSPMETQRIKIWKKNVQDKMALNTRIMKEWPRKLEPSQLSIEIGRMGLYYYVKIKYTNEGIFEMQKPSPSKAFCAVAHFARAQELGCDPNMHTDVNGGRRELKKAIIHWLGSGTRIKDPSVAMEKLFEALFTSSGGTKWAFGIPKNKIVINVPAAIENAKYKTSDGSMKGCLKFGQKKTDV
jgi:hypothetical protein